MTGTALQAIGPTMNVVIAMAKPALLATGAHFFHRAMVASTAFQIFVRTFEIEARLAVVVEVPALPPDRVVALTATGSQQTLVIVIFRVAVAAFRRCTSELLVGMAGFTTYGRVLPK